MAPFTPATFRFLKDLAANNTREWFADNKPRYLSDARDPALTFVEAFAPRLRALSPHFVADPRPVGGSLFRIHRDTRFSKDKTPYKTGLFLLFTEGSGPLKNGAGFGLHLHAEGIGMMGGVFGFEDAALARYREAVLDARRGKALEKAVAAVEEAGCGLNEPHYKRVPRGFDAEYPRADWLRYRALHAHCDEHPVPKALLGPQAVDFCLERFSRMRPVQKWVAALL